MSLLITQYLEILHDMWDENVREINRTNYELCKFKTIEAINNVKHILKTRPWGKYNDFYNNVLIFGIMFKSLDDLLDIIGLTNDNTWLRDNKTIEEVWRKMIDCKERSLFVKDYLPEGFLEFIMTNIKNLEGVFNRNWGDSMYMSVEFIYDPICNICFDDLRTCEHEKNVIYNGKLCKIIRKNFTFKMSNVVDEPHDFRCRIWSWNINLKNPGEAGGSTFESAIFTFFSVDDFLDDDEQ